MEITIGEVIKYYRNKLNISQDMLAEGICSRKYIGDIEHGKSIPTLDMVNQLSRKLGTDLYATYSSLFRYPDFETYLICKEIGRTIGRRDFKRIEKCVEEYADRENFFTGEPRQIICQAKAIISGLRYEFDSAQRVIEEGMRINHPTFPRLETDKGYSNVELALLLSYGVTLGRMNKIQEAAFFFDSIKRQATSGLAEKYEAEKNRAFYLNLLCSAVYNKYIFCPQIPDHVISEIDEILEYQRTNNRIHMITELLLCKADCLYLTDIKAAKKAYSQAKVMGTFYYGEKRFKQLEKQILKKKC